MTGGVVNYLDTISAARDLEAVRAALGEKMNWLGMSYGSQLGAQYAELFPDNVRAMVFDGILQHSQADSSNILIEGTAYATALESFFAWASKHDSSPLRGQDVEKLWYSILENATSSPIPAPDCKDACRRDVNAEEIRLNAQAFLTSATDPARMMFADALQQASKGNASLLSTQFPDSHNPFGFAGLAIGCQDWPSRAPSFADFQAKMRIGELFAPLNNGASQTWTLQASCVGWPAPPRNPPAKLKVKTKNPILMVQSTRDPSSSYAWAAGMMEEIENHVLLMRNGDGHTSWAQFPATTDAINQFLISLEPPAPGTVLEE
jgi:pimeloyl-ACP methyl ester carboxylesterase